mgnify:CR=1
MQFLFIRSYSAAGRKRHRAKHMKSPAESAGPTPHSRTKSYAPGVIGGSVGMEEHLGTNSSTEVPVIVNSKSS